MLSPRIGQCFWLGHSMCTADERVTGEELFSHKPKRDTGGSGRKENDITWQRKSKNKKIANGLCRVGNERELDVNQPDPRLTRMAKDIETFTRNKWDLVESRKLQMFSGRYCCLKNAVKSETLALLKGHHTLQNLHTHFEYKCISYGRKKSEK